MCSFQRYNLSVSESPRGGGGEGAAVHTLNLNELGETN